MNGRDQHTLTRGTGVRRAVCGIARSHFYMWCEVDVRIWIVICGVVFVEIESFVVIPILGVVALM